MRGYSPAAAVAPGLDFKGYELAVALAVALAIPVLAAVALARAALDKMADAPDIDPGIAIPIKVKPMLDLSSPLLKLGGKRVSTKLPDRWIRKTPVKRVERQAHVSTKAEANEDDIPPDDLPIADAGTDPPEPDAALAKQVDEEETEESDAGPSNVDQEGSPDGEQGGTETDPLKARAISRYRSRLIGFFKARFRGAQGTGLSPEELEKLAASAAIAIGSDLSVISFTLSPSGNAAFDAAVRAVLQSKVGQQVPPPPENFPEAKLNHVSVTFVCQGNCS